MKKIVFSSVFILLLVWIPVHAKIHLPSLFGSNMVLQQKSDVTVLGWADPQEMIRVSTNWDTAIAKVKTDNYARWKVVISTPAAGGPYSITISSSDTVVLKNVLIGEVWICSGQSNMEMSATWGFDHAAEEVAQANYPEIRLFQVEKRASDYPQQDAGGHWEVCSPATMKTFSATAYFFGRELFKNLNIPIGLINSSWGGSPAEAWINPSVISGDEILAAAAKKISDTMPWSPGKPGKIYNAMVAPFIPFRLAGAIWYQCETNTANPEAYASMMSALIRDWRTEWNEDLPFYYVQISPYNYEKPFEGALVREAQLKCLSVPNTGMVVISDIGNLTDIHPKDKQNVGKRLAAWALAKTYGKTGIAYSGPLYQSMKIEKNKIRIYFDYADHGLTAKGGPLTCFQIAGSDGTFTDADAKLDGSTVVVSSKKVKSPAAVRFAFTNTSMPNLFNTEGLPASCFRTDDWKIEIK